MTSTFYKKLLIKLTFCVLLAVCAISGSAQTTAFTYQGRLTDNAMSANGSYDMQFRVYDQATNGTQKGITVTRTAVLVANGIFTVSIDPTFTAFFNQAGNYLEISVRLNGGSSYTPLLPRQPITSAPYAVQSISSQNADSLAGIPATNYLQTNGSGANLTNLNASNITAGMLPDAQLSPNVAFRNQANTFAGDQTINGNLTQTGTTASLNLTNGFLARGTLNTGAIPATGAGVRMLFYPRKAAFRAGRVTSDQWDDANIGDNSVALGGDTKAINSYSTAMGYNTTASGPYSTAMGNTTTASGYHSVALGYNTTASGLNSIATGYGTKASGIYSTALGNTSSAIGDYSTVMGYNSFAYGNYSTVLGNYADTTTQGSGSFVYGDSSSTDFVISSTPNQFVVRASGGFRFRTNASLITGCDLPAGSGVFQCTSSKSVKENFVALNGTDILSRLRRVPVMQWNYIGEKQNVRHVGAFAEDFYQAFNLGTDDKSIGLLDVAGVNMAATKTLDEKTENLQTQIETQQQIIERQQKQIDALIKLTCAATPSADVCKQEKK